MTVPPREAATVVLLREGSAGPETLMVRRNRGASFMADAHVFPGGRLDETDGGDFAFAAAREAFEETGVLLAVDPAGRPASTDGEWVEPARAEVRGGSLSFADLLARRGLHLDGSALLYFARWITPPSEPRRFDARFFLARMPAGQTARPDLAGEVVEHRWATPQGFLDAYRREELKLPPPTLWHLEDLRRHPTVATAFAWAAGVRVAPVRPRFHPLGDTLAILLPWDPEYGSGVGEPPPPGEPTGPDHPNAGPVSRYVLEGGRFEGRPPPGKRG